MIRGIALACIAVFPAAAQTTLQDMPALYDVVTPGEAVIARDWPSPTGHEVGRIAPGTATVEVILAEPSLGWAMVNLAETKGWVRLSALSRRAGQWEDFALPASLSCFGNEPGWRLEVTDGAATLIGQNFDQLEVSGVFSQRAQGRGDRWSLFSGEADAAAASQDDLSVVVARGLCSDGMTDREFGLTADAILRQDGAAPLHLAGCCSLLP